MAPSTAVLRRSAIAFAAALPLAAAALCTSDGTAPPRAVLERFVNADCEACWRDPQTPDAAAGTLALDWVLPGGKGDDAPLAAVASRDGLERLRAAGLPGPAQASARTLLRSGRGPTVRVAQGAVFNDYIGASVEVRQAGTRPLQAWLLLVETLPAGTEGSPVARNLVRNTFQPPWDQPRRQAPARLSESRAMQVHAGARPERLRLVALVEDAQGRLLAATQSVCR
jgi:hypothetical protein